MNKFRLNTDGNQPLTNLLERVEMLDIFSEKMQSKIVMLVAGILQVDPKDTENVENLKELIGNLQNLMKALQIFNPMFTQMIISDLTMGLNTQLYLKTKKSK